MVVVLEGMGDKLCNVDHVLRRQFLCYLIPLFGLLLLRQLQQLLARQLRERNNMKLEELAQEIATEIGSENNFVSGFIQNADLSFSPELDTERVRQIVLKVLLENKDDLL